MRAIFRGLTHIFSIGTTILLSSCGASAQSKNGEQNLVPTIINTNVDLDSVSGSRFTPGATPAVWVLGTDGSVAIALPGPFPGRIVHIEASGRNMVLDGILASDAPLRFVSKDGQMVAESLDGTLVYRAHERVIAAELWSPEPPAEERCCAWWEPKRTLWRAAPSNPSAGLLRAVTWPSPGASVLDWYLPDVAKPAWRLLLTKGPTGIAAAAVAPDADQFVVALTERQGKSLLRAHATRDGKPSWTVPLEATPEWPRNGGRIAYSADGARIVVLLQDPAHCESCAALHVFDSTTGKHVCKFSLVAIMASEFISIGITGHTVWAFEHVLPKNTDMSSRPERWQYEAYVLATGAHRTLAQTVAEWGLKAHTTWALLPRPGREGVVGLGRSPRGTLTITTGDEAP